MEINDLARAYRDNASVIKRLEAERETMAKELVDTFHTIGTRSLSLPGVGTFSVVVKEVWDWGNDVKVANEVLKQARDKEKESREPDEKKEHLRFQAEPTLHK